MAIALVSSVSKNGPSGGGTTASIDTTGANFIVLPTGRYSATSATPTDNKGNTYTALTNVQNTSAFGIAGRIWYCANPTVGTGHTFSFAAASLYPSFGAAAFSGVDTSSPFNKESTNNNGNVASSTSQPGSVTPDQNDSLIIALSAYESTSVVTISGGFTELFDYPLTGGAFFGGMAAYLIQTTATAANPTTTYAGSNANVTAIAVFKPAAGGGGGAMGPVLRGRVITPGRIFGGSALMRQGLSWASARERQIQQIERRIA